MDPGRLDRRAIFLRRPQIDETTFGDYEPVFTVWANFKQTSLREANQGGAAQNIESGTLAVRTSSQTKTITNGDRVVLDGQLVEGAVVDGRTFNIGGVGMPDRLSGKIILQIATDLGGQ
ncbi:phage head completion protein [Methylobacterium gnaphalii]|uniref:Head-tail adaptor protein n=1 Tax=Methylobacterium gnaphalii TaxID=1010610 RepID=A0A512JQM5_9HYPH|nr:head-tail adaptor protein [Methylobacterium gnaphalii]GEP12258.1 hypothetical protein MGN01_41030 [Methylobacterium gnaphalii]GJD68738.1 hypothetical protein MMMDOFMJ_1662 [Methylobacterium gnaphalii]GLS49365.1 hypothetical protein GCM10007885_22130 [Methylobacterium gnaphalii]